LKLGGKLYEECPDHESWIAAMRRHGYSAAYCPITADADDSVVLAYERAAASAGFVIAEVGVWNNPLSRDEATRQTAIEHCKRQLDLADRLGARCAVNIAGSRGEKWDGPGPDDLTPEAFDMIVELVRNVIDSVKPTRTYYALETMPWMYPNSAEDYTRLIKAIDRKQFAVHFDPVNLICSPERYFRNGELIGDFIAKLGPHIRSCHAKDVLLHPNFLVHLDEVRPGTGTLDFRTLLREIAKLDPDTPLMMEHMKSEEEYSLAAEYIRSVAGEVGVKFG